MAERRRQRTEQLNHLVTQTVAQAQAAQQSNPICNAPPPFSKLALRPHAQPSIVADAPSTRTHGKLAVPSCATMAAPQAPFGFAAPRANPRYSSAAAASAESFFAEYVSTDAAQRATPRDLLAAAASAESFFAEYASADAWQPCQFPWTPQAPPPSAPPTPPPQRPMSFLPPHEESSQADCRGGCILRTMPCSTAALIGSQDTPVLDSRVVQLDSRGASIDSRPACSKEDWINDRLDGIVEALGRSVAALSALYVFAIYSKSTRPSLRFFVGAVVTTLAPFALFGLGCKRLKLSDLKLLQPAAYATAYSRTLFLGLAYTRVIELLFWVTDLPREQIVAHWQAQGDWPAIAIAPLVAAALQLFLILGVSTVMSIAYCRSGEVSVLMVDCATLFGTGIGCAASVFTSRILSAAHDARLAC
eukprot:CAMPEP_0183336940 /NCGR_PEP_ID=MMETSP0164_2-20130417/4770_1 /TAXON_ID=221442 /ORGANISM="Coccolithus pelagicus ssp braarudi, Strain PLY182g" /LENGTH=417 /DNA_ID=CAMNT_0025506563 /DNA_START=35 /DNA_END=1287 /DNA_ORIENTATION=-